MSRSAHLKQLIAAYERSPQLFHATPYWESYQDRLVRSVQGMDLTESYAMTPAASVSGLYLSHPQAKYFNIGRIGRDQLEDYAKRKGMTVEEMSRWLGM